MAKLETYLHILNMLFFFNFQIFLDVYLFGIIAWVLINMDFIVFDIWALLTLNWNDIIKM
jgi:hypothetical protein